MEEETLLQFVEKIEGDHEDSNTSFEEMRSFHLSNTQKTSKAQSVAARKILPWIAHIVFFSVSLGILVISVNIQRSLPANCMEARRQWSVTMGSIPEGNHYMRSKGSFNRSSSPFKGPPSPAVDKAWSELTDYGAISISEETYEKLNASKNAVKVPSDYGGGRQAFLEVLHQLHCLKWLWWHTYPDYYIEAAENIRNGDEQWHEHMDHCADMLRQKLMCDADVHLLTYNWVEGHDAPHPNFNIPRQCRNFEAVKKYALDHALDGSNLPKGYFMKPKDGSVMEYKEPPFDPLDGGRPSR